MACASAMAISGEQSLCYGELIDIVRDCEMEEFGE